MFHYTQHRISIRKEKDQKLWENKQKPAMIKKIRRKMKKIYMYIVIIKIIFTFDLSRSRFRHH